MQGVAKGSGGVPEEGVAEASGRVPEQGVAQDSRRVPVEGVAEASGKVPEQGIACVCVCGSRVLSAEVVPTAGQPPLICDSAARIRAGSGFSVSVTHPEPPWGPPFTSKLALASTASILCPHPQGCDQGLEP